ncbi:MAG: hypothetical protein H5T92_08860, partial [Synergistales bacterium]|nr:hypothetical protein [Synergistales bacterium]
MRRALTVVVVFLLALSAFGQEPSGCNPIGPIVCESELSFKSFSIPLGAVYSAICTFFPKVCALKSIIAKIAAGTLIPSIKIQLGAQATINEIQLRCSPGCCPEGRLYAQPCIRVIGTTQLPGLVPVDADVIKYIVGEEIEDGGQYDQNPDLCAIANVEGFKIPIKDFSVSLVFLDNFTWEVHRVEEIFKGTVRAAVKSTWCLVSYGCKPFEKNKPPTLVVPTEYKVPVGLETMIPIGVYDEEGNPVRVYLPSNFGGIASLVYDQDKKSYYLAIRVPEDYSGSEKLVLDVYAYDLRFEEGWRPLDEPKPGQYYHVVPGTISLKIVRNQPPQAISQEEELPCPNLELGYCFGPVIFAATDPDLPEGNFGY